MRRSTHTTLRRLAGTSVIVAATVIPASAAMAADYPNNNGSTPPTPSESSTVSGATTSQSTLPFTGGDVIGLAVIGAGAALAGTVLVRRSKRLAAE
jgi:hypothetical protein